MKTYNQLVTKIKTVLSNGVTGVQEYHETIPTAVTKFPAVVIFPVGHENNYHDLRDTRRRYTFTIRVYGHMTLTEGDAQSTVRGLVDTIIGVLEKNITLDGDVDFSMPTSARFEFDQKTTEIFYADITYLVNQRFDRLT